jgi:radical SAM superfamily enzyme YgiQ (UPF0313 family)
MTTSVYLTDLRYNYTGFLANDCMPLGVGYMKAVMDRDLPDVRSRLFAYPDTLWESLKQNPPDVLMLSNYCWNEALSFHFAKLAKKIRPDTLVVMGGPNISIEPDRQLAYMGAHPEIDFYVLGEGDFLATEIVRNFLEAGKSLQRLGAREVPSCIYRRPTSELVRQTASERHNEIDEIPSPWLTGAMDEFFDGKLCPLMETNRGCPFTCTFCVQGTRWYTKVHNFSLPRIQEEIEYVAHRIHTECPSMGTLRLADSNYGMYERDIEISGYLGQMQRKYGWPDYIDATTGKNRPDRIIKSMEQVSGALVLYQAVQSLDETVLKNIKRSTIKLEAYHQLLVHVRGRGLRSNSDLILGLPGETLETHVNALHRLLDTGISQVTNFQLMMLKGSELETIETRNQFRFDTRFRVLPKNFGTYGGETVFDVEEIVVGTESLSFEDYVACRKYALISVAFWHNNYLEKPLQVAEKWGVKRSEWLAGILQELDNSGGVLREFVDNFVTQTIGELFPTREACVQFYSEEENFQKLLSGEVGENLMHKHNAISSFYIWPHICRAGMNVIRNLLLARGIEQKIADFEAFWSDFHLFVELEHAWGRTVEAILAPSSISLRYDIDAWLSAGSPNEIAEYRFDQPEEFRFQLTPEGSEKLEAALRVWTTDIKGLTKMVTRIQPTWQERVCTPVRSLEMSQAIA